MYVTVKLYSTGIYKDKEQTHVLPIFYVVGQTYKDRYGIFTVTYCRRCDPEKH